MQNYKDYKNLYIKYKSKYLKLKGGAAISQDNIFLLYKLYD
jgi:hypothetical protein